jgi:hypothetical protein
LVRPSRTITATSSWAAARSDRVVPFRIELIPCDVDALHLGSADFDALLVAACVELCRVPAPAASCQKNSENSKANRIETMKGPAESGQICSVGRRKIAKKIAKNKRCYANTL